MVFVTFVVVLAVTYCMISSYVLAFGVPWRPLRLGGAPESRRDRRDRMVALAVTVLSLVTAYLMLALPYAVSASRIP